MVTVLEYQSGHVAQCLRSREDLGRHVRWNAVGERVLGRPCFESGRESRQHRRVTEHLSDVHVVKNLAIVHDLDRCRANHAKCIDGTGTFGEYDLPRGMEFDFHHAGEYFESLRVESGEGWVLLKKLNDVGWGRQRLGVPAKHDDRTRRVRDAVLTR